MKIRAYNFIYFIKLAFKGMFKNGVMTLASIVILMSCLIVMGSSWCIGENHEVYLDKLDGYNKIVVFVEENTEDFAVQEVG
jgi:cell division transport system permease protein